MAYANRHILKNPASIEIDGVEYKDQVWVVTLTPDQPVVTQRTFGGVDQVADTATWVLALTGHNWHGTGGLAKDLQDAATAGEETMEVVIQFLPGTGKPVVTVNVLPVAIPYGGEAGSLHQFEVELQVIDQPVWTTSA
jgi:hypothetical protein